MTEWDHGASWLPCHHFWRVLVSGGEDFTRTFHFCRHIAGLVNDITQRTPQRLVVELEVSFWGWWIMSQMDQQPTSPHVKFFGRMNFQREWCSTDNTVLAECHRNKVHFLVEPFVGALLQNEICRSFHFHILDSRGSTIFSVEVRHACIFVTMNMCRSNILKVLYWNMHASELL